MTSSIVPVARTWIPSLLATVILFSLLPLELDLFYYALLIVFLINIVLASSWNLLGGSMGYYSLGHAGFFGLGASVTALAARELAIYPPLATFVGAAVAVCFAVVVGYACLRLTGDYFAIATLGLAIVIAVVAREPSLGMWVVVIPKWQPLPPLTMTIHFAYASLVALAVGTVVLTRIISRSKFGYTLAAIRDDETVAKTLGIPTFRYKMAALMISSLIVGLAGGLYAQYIGSVAAEGIFNLRYSFFPVIMALIGGIHDWRGPVLGAVILTLTHRFLVYNAPPQLTLIALGLILLAMVTFMPTGIIGLLRKRLDS